MSIYDTIAEDYDRIWSRQEDLEENDALAFILKDLIAPIGYAPDVLDVGCGTGLFLDLKVPYRNYLGIDPSVPMLMEHRAKYSKRTIPRLIPATFWDANQLGLLDEPGYDLVVSLFAAASYLTPEERRLTEVLARRALVLMTYRPGYVPDYYPEGSEERALQLANAQAAHDDTAAMWEDIRKSPILGWQSWSVGTLGQFTVWSAFR